MPRMNAMRSHWTLDPDVVFLNHGSFGATPRVVQEAQAAARAALERDPIRYLAPERELEPKLDVVRARAAALLGAPASDIAFVRNATDGVNAVLRSLPRDPDAPFSVGEGDSILVTSHGYNACTNAARYVAERHGARVEVAEIPFPLRSSEEAYRAIVDACTDWTKLILIDTVTSPTGLVLPVDRVVRFARERGIRVLVDAAHAAGMVDVDLAKLGADYVTGNFHKWICAPKVSGFLYVRPELQDEVRPAVISHAANTPRPGRSRFLAEFDWTGTFDPTALLAVPAALDFLERLDPAGLKGVQRLNRELALGARDVLTAALGIDAPAPDDMIGSLVTLPLPPGPPPEHGRLDPLQTRLRDRHSIEVPVWNLGGHMRLLRISAQRYNDLTEYERLAAALEEEFAATKGSR